MKRKSNLTKNRKNKRKVRKTLKRKQTRLMRGGNSTLFPSSFSNNDVAVSPQSYLPFNNFQNDPGYNVVASRNTGPFLTGGFRKRRGTKNYSFYGGGTGLSATISNGANSLTNGVGILPSPSINETSGVSGIMSVFSGTSSSYSSVPKNIAPLSG